MAANFPQAQIHAPPYACTHTPHSCVTPLAPTHTQRPRLAYRCELERFHSPEYVDFLAKVLPETQGDYQPVSVGGLT